MRTFFYFLLLLAVAVAGGLLIAQDPGYVLITYGVWTIEAPLWLAVTATILLSFLLVALFSLFHSAQNLWRGLMTLRKRLKKKRARINTERGFVDLLNGSWRLAEQRLTQGIYDQKKSLLNYLGAAIAAQEQGKEEKRDDYLRLAHNHNGKAELAVGLTQARLQYISRHYEQCLATLERLHRLSPSNDYTLQLLQKVYTKLKDWSRLLDHLVIMKKRKLLTREQFEKFTREASLEHFAKLQTQNVTFVIWYECFNNLPDAYQREESFLKLYLPVCLREDPAQALQLIKDALKQAWSDELVHYLGMIQNADMRDVLAYCESLLKKHPNNAALRLTLGRLSLQNQLWGKASQHLEIAAANAHSPEACYELAKLHKQLGDSAKAQHFFQLGLELVINVRN